MSFDTFFTKFINFAPVVFVCFYFTQRLVFINAADSEIHHAVLEKKKLLYSLSQQLYILELELPFWVINVWKKHFHQKIQTIFFFHVVLSKPQHVKSLRHSNLPYSVHLKGFFNFTCKQPQQYSNPKPHTLIVVIYIFTSDTLA